MDSKAPQTPLEPEFRIERDTLGEVRVPAHALYGAQTQRALDNFQISGLRFPALFIQSLAAIKRACAIVNGELGELEAPVAEAIREAAEEVIQGKHDDQFPLDVFQTGSGTSTNMNMNEVLATLAGRKLERKVHPNDHVNRSQSSNDVIPSAIHVSAYRGLVELLLPALESLRSIIDAKAAALAHVVKTGRTHLMDAVPLRMSQELGGWSAQIADAAERVRARLPALAQLAIGGTAIGTGINAPPGFGAAVAARLARDTGYPFQACRNTFAALSGQDAAVDASAALRGAAVAMTKIANDLRWMNSGPHAGLAEISLPALQPGSSIMPAKVNPVIPEAVLMACAQVIGNDLVIAIAGQSGSFQLNTMLPVIAYNLLQSIQLLANSARSLGERAIHGFQVNEDRIRASLDRNPILATALNPKIGYERAAEIAKRAMAEQRAVRDVAKEMTGLPPETIDELLDPARLTGEL
jgi:fumarate hydratase class II